VQEFIKTYPGTGSFQPAVTAGFPLWLRVLHLLNLLLIAFIIRAGIQILADHPRLDHDAGCYPGREILRLRGPVPPERMKQEPPERAWTAKDDAVSLPGWLGIPGIRHSIGLARWWHFSCDLLWVLTGAALYLLLFTTGQWRRLVPVDWNVIPNAVSTAIQYGSLNFPANLGWTQFNGLQLLSYFLAVFVAAPLAIITGLRQAPAIAAKFGLGWGRINRQVARIVHFAVLTFFVWLHRHPYRHGLHHWAAAEPQPHHHRHERPVLVGLVDLRHLHGSRRRSLVGCHAADTALPAGRTEDREIHHRLGQGAGRVLGSARDLPREGDIAVLLAQRNTAVQPAVRESA
jgi:hypothetical protein